MRSDSISPEREAHLFAIGDLDSVVIAHFPLVFGIVSRIRTNRVDLFDDMVQQGRVALVIASRSFDPSRGVRFMTYAKKRVHSAAIDVLRSARRAERGEPFATESTYEAHVDPFIVERIKVALLALTDRERLIVESRFMRDEPIKIEALGRMVGISGSRAHYYQERARAKLKALLSDAA